MRALVRIIVLPIVLGLLVGGVVVAGEAPGAAPPAAKSVTPLGLTVEQAFGVTLRYDFGVVEGGKHFHLDVAFRDGEVEWHELWENGKSEIDPIRAVRLDEHRLLASWPEQNGWFIVLYADFATGETSYCGRSGGEKPVSKCMTGTIARLP